MNDSRRSWWAARCVLFSILVLHCNSCTMLRLAVQYRTGRIPKPAKKEDSPTGTSSTAPAPVVATSPDDLTPGLAPAGVTAEEMPEGAGFAPAENRRAVLTGWKRSASEAIQESRRTGKPMLVAATNQQLESSQQLEAALLASKEFRDLTSEAFILLLLDYGEKETLKSDFYRDFKTRLNLRGFPTLVILLPDGKEMVRLKGYMPDWKGRYMQSIKDAIPHCAQAVAERRKKMILNGYRIWSTPAGGTVFAKLTSIDTNQATFTGEWGDEFRTFITRLNAEDQKWIAAHGG